MRFILVALLLLSLNSWAVDVLKIVKQSEDQTLEKIVAETFTNDEFIQWLETRDRFNTQEKEKNDQQLACVVKGGNVKTCVDPHWCLYPDKLSTDECFWYRTKYKMTK